MSSAQKKLLAVLIAVMLVMPVIGMVRRLAGDDRAEHPFSWQMYTVVSDQQ